MDEVAKFLAENHPFYLATVEDGKPKVRPMGFSMEYEGKLIFATPVAANKVMQMEQTPYIEVSAASQDYRFIRIAGKVEFISDVEKKQAILDAVPNLQQIAANPEGIAIFYPVDAEATIISLAGAPAETYQL